MTTRGKPFEEGRSGNPAGRPKGARNRTTLAVAALLEGEAEALGRKAIELALEGDTVALRLCLERICPPRKDRPSPFALPNMDDVADVRGAIGAVLKAVAEGDLTAGEAHEVAGLIEIQRRVIETHDIATRLAAIEVRLGADRAGR